MSVKRSCTLRHFAPKTHTEKKRNCYADATFFRCLTLTKSVCHASQAMCFQLRDALRVGCIGFSNKFFSNSMESKEMIKIIDDELRNFCILVEAPKTPFGRPKKTYSGKVGGRNDDVAIVLQLAITGARQ